MVNVHVLVTCRGKEHLPLSLLVFDTIRVGFPTARIVVCDNASDYGVAEIVEEAREVGAELWVAPKRMEHGEFIRDQLGVATHPTVFVDTDVIFWESVEDIQLPEGRLYGGRYIPEMMECGARMPARIHPSLLFIPDPKALLAALAPFHKKYWYFRPFQGSTLVEGAMGSQQWRFFQEGGVVCWDTCAGLYAALPEAAYTFTEKELDRYDHLFGGTYPDRFEEMEMSRETKTLLRNSHALALSPDRDKLRGLWRLQIRPYTRPEKPSWNYWSGVLSNAAGLPQFSFMHAEFTAPGIEPFSHTAILELVGGDRRCAGDHAKLGVTFSALPKPKAPPCLAAGIELHEADVVGVADFTLTAFGETFKNLQGKLWYEHEDRQVVPGSGWRWMSLRFDDGRNVLLYDRSNAPQRYTTLGPSGWTPLVAEVTVLERTAYESKWSVELDGWTYTVAPVSPNQEIKDEARGLSYLEALCSITDASGELVGTAFVEILPEGERPTTVVKSTVPQAEMHLRWARQNKDAADLMGLFGYATQLADDLVDLDRKWVTTDEGRADVMSELLLSCLIYIPANPFFHENRHHYGPLFVSCLGTWEATVSWGKSKRKETRIFAYVLRESCARLFEMTAFLVGGARWQRQVVRELHEYYHASGGVESFEAWEKGG